MTNMTPIPLATVEELQGWLSWDLSAGEEREATGALAVLSDEARSVGDPGWLDDTITPGAVKNLVLKAAARYMKNYDGFTMSRAGDETVQFSDNKLRSGSAYFTQDERDALAKHAGMGTGWGSVGTYAYGKTWIPQNYGNAVGEAAGYVPGFANTPFPMFANGNDPW